MGQAESQSASIFSNDTWEGSWALDYRENWTPYLDFMGVPPANHEAATRAPDFHKYRVESSAFTMEHQIPAQNLNLLFRADLDGQWCDSPYPRPTVAHWAEGGEQSMPCWRNMWVEEPICFKTEIPDFMGKRGKTLTIERRVVSSQELKMTIHVLEGDALVVGPCWAYFKRLSCDGPTPLAWLRTNGKPLKTAEQRKEALGKVLLMVSENIDAITAAHKQDRVMPPAFNGVAQMLMGGCRMYESLISEWLAPESIEDTCPAPLKAGVEADWSIINEPKGVCINVSPWNAPVQLSIIPVLAMLAAGNLAVIKPPDLVPAISALLRRLCQKYLHGYVWVEEGGKEVVERLIDEGADHLVFTGGGEIAKVVAARCAQRLTPVTLELGGKSPVFIDKDLQGPMLESAVREILQTKVFKTGQFCCAHDYALVHEEIHKRFCDEFTSQLEGIGEQRNVPLLGKRQYAAMKEKLEEAAVEAIPAMHGPFVPNDEAMTIPMSGLLAPSFDKNVLKAEIFGPLLPIVKVKDVTEAIDTVNGMPTGKPLIAYCYSENTESIEAFVNGTSSGNVAVNGGPQRMISNFNCGFGGVGPSGTGVGMWGREALREFSNRKYVMKAKEGFARSYFSGPPPPMQT